MIPKNRKSHTAIESDLVYPLDHGYCYVAQLDKEWVEFRLMCMGVKTICNKYCVAIESNDGQILLVTNHDEKYWLTSKKINKQ